MTSKQQLELQSQDQTYIIVLFLQLGRVLIVRTTDSQSGKCLEESAAQLGPYMTYLYLDRSGGQHIGINTRLASGGIRWIKVELKRN